MEIDLESLDYEVHFENISHPGREMDHHEVRDAMAKVLTNWGLKLEDGIESTDEITKSIH